MERTTAIPCPVRRSAVRQVPAASAWPVTDGVVVLVPPGPGDRGALVAGRDAESQRWLGSGDLDPVACVRVGAALVGWVDYDTERDWLGPHEVNVGYNVFPAHRRRGYATRAVSLLLDVLRRSTDYERANLAIDVANVASLGVARALGVSLLDRVLDATGAVVAVHFGIDVGGPRPDLPGL